MSSIGRELQKEGYQPYIHALGKSSFNQRSKLGFRELEDDLESLPAEQIAFSHYQHHRAALQIFLRVKPGSRDFQY
jgi:hypothetical protein